MSKIFSIKQTSILKSSYLLLDDGKTVGRLARTGVFKSKVSGAMDGLQWRFVKSIGLKGTRISVLALDSNEVVATFHRPIFRQSGTLRLNGVEYGFKVGSWRSRYIWIDAAGKDTPLLTITLGGFFKQSGTVEIADRTLQLPGYKLLLVLGLYLSMDAEEANAAVGGGS
jgi:hypothetical protein